MTINDLKLLLCCADARSAHQILEITDIPQGSLYNQLNRLARNRLIEQLLDGRFVSTPLGTKRAEDEFEKIVNIMDTP